MASTTTALLTLEEAAKENKIVTISEQVAAVEGSSMYLNAGDRLSLRDLAIVGPRFQVMMLHTRR